MNDLVPIAVLIQLILLIFLVFLVVSFFTKPDGANILWMLVIALFLQVLGEV
jgi:hypothetical protein